MIHRLKNVYLHHNKLSAADKLELYLDDGCDFISFKMSSTQNDIKLVYKPKLLDH